MRPRDDRDPTLATKAEPSRRVHAARNQASNFFGKDERSQRSVIQNRPRKGRSRREANISRSRSMSRRRRASEGALRNTIRITVSNRWPRYADPPRASTLSCRFFEKFFRRFSPASRRRQQRLVPADSLEGAALGPKTRRGFSHRTISGLRCDAEHVKLVNCFIPSRFSDVTTVTLRRLYLTGHNIPGG
jgi:hypothetical protein